jgi:3-methylcrotonyl-CoA carboxylase alpha subunit
VQGPRHIEFQVFGDTHGNYAHLFERECSIQRRHQKVLEETPSPFLDDAMRTRMGEAATAAARAIQTRLQVEHPVTEMITGEDLVEWQLRVAAGETLPLTQPEIHRAGHSIEVRLCAEDPANDFLPETGRVRVLREPAQVEGAVRLDTGVREGDEISVFYDPMIAKLVAWGSDRDEAVRRLQEAAAETAMLGVKTNLAFLERVLRHPAFLAGETDTGFIARHRDALVPPAGQVPPEALVAAAVRILLDERAGGVNAPVSPWDDTSGWRMNQPARRDLELRLADGAVVDIVASMRSAGASFEFRGQRHEVGFGPASGDRLQLTLDDETYFARVLRLGERLTAITPQGRYELDRVDPFHYEPPETLPDARLTSLMPGRVVKVLVAPGQAVRKGEALLILEAMKMEHTIVSPREGTIDRVAFRENDLVPADAVLVAFAQ